MKQRAGAKKHAKFYTIDAIDLARKVGMGNRINTIMQAAFFKLAEVIPYEQADEYMKAYAKKAYGKKGDEVVKKNWDAIDIAISGLVEVKVPAEVGRRHHRRCAREGGMPPSTSTTVVEPILAQEGDKLPVSTFDPRRPRAHRHHQVREARHRRHGSRMDMTETASSAATALWFAPMPASVPTC